MLAHETDLSEELEKLFKVRAEWLLTVGESNGFAVQASEIEVVSQNGKIVLSCPTARGWQTWIVQNWEQAGEKLSIHTARKIKSGAATLEFTPRVSVENLQADVKEARLIAARELAEIVRKTFSGFAKIERVSLNQSNRRGKVGTIARILLALPNGKTVAVCGSVVEKTDAANLLSNAIFWLNKLEERRRIAELWLVADEKSAANLSKFHALLRDGWRDKIKIVHRRNTEAQSLEKDSLEFVEALSFSDLWNEKPKKLNRPRVSELSETAQQILEIEPNSIDVVRSKHGETLRFNGLPFVRIRELLGEEKIWFGIEGKTKRILDATNLNEFEILLNQLREHRQAETSDKRNAIYRAAPESWLESCLRRDVSRLDPNLILAPLFAQFRLSNKKGALDLLALRTDGRLVVIELKTTTDREHIFQAVDYWRQVELQRRAGNLQNLFGDLEILDAPPLVYLVAPLISFHRDFEILANAVSPEIEIWRFDLNEDWRGGVRVARRTNFAEKILF